MNRRDALRLLGSGSAAFAGAAYLGRPVSGEPSPHAILTRPIPSSGEALPVIGLGTWSVFDVGTDPGARAGLEEVLRVFVGMGGKVIDSSPMYGSSETVAGDLAAKLSIRPKLFVATKVWTTGKEQGIAQMADSERKLKAKPLDLVQVHNLVDVETQLATLADWKKEGRVRYTGVTHYTAAKHEDVARVLEKHDVDFVQINYSVGEREAEARLLPLAKERGVAVIANRPFVGGKLLKKLKGEKLPDFAAEIDCASWPQLLLKFVVSHPAITCAIPATSRADHMRDDLGAGFGRMPDEKLRARIAAAVA
jgi:diketogulonate reductase-like aldo/keto reductase